MRASSGQTCYRRATRCAASLIDRAFDELLTFDHRFLSHAAATVGAVTGSAARLTLGFLTVSWRATIRIA